LLLIPKMNILFQTRTNLFDAPGGDMIQMLKTQEYLQKQGIKVDISLELEPDLKDYDLVHLFNLMEPQDIYIQMLNAKKQNKKVVLSTIYGLYTEFERKARGGLFQKLANYLSPFQISYIKVLIKHFKERRLHKGVYKMIFKGYYGLMNEIVNNTSVFLPNSDSEMKRVIHDFKLDNPRYVSVPNAVDVNLFSSKNVFDIKYEKFRGCILCAARIEGRKSTLNLVRAVKETPYHLVLVGKESSNQKEYVQAVHKEAGDNVTFLGPVDHEELKNLYSVAKVHALVSWMETPGLSSLEAAAMGINIVVTPNGDTYDYFEDYAFYCEPDDVESIKKAIDKAYNSPWNPKLKQKIIEKYTWEQSAIETLKAYNLAIQ